MTDKNTTGIMLIVDRSGSMADIRLAAEDGVNEFIRGQAKAEGRRVIRLVEFDTSYDVVIPSTIASECGRYVLIPRGGTALLDAMGRGITEFGQELADLPEDERPAVVIVAIMTDGEENSSVEYTYDQIREMVAHQEDVYRWQILYLGANQDAIAEAAKLGVRASRSMSYAATDHNTRAVYDSMNTYVATASAGAPAEFTDDDREKATRS